MESMLTPSVATSRATTPNASAVIGLPEHHDRVRGRLAQHRHVVAALDRDVQADADGWRASTSSRSSCTARDVGRAGHQHAQRQPAPDHDLLDVRAGSTLCRDSTSKQRRRHAWLVDVR